MNYAKGTLNKTIVNENFVHFFNNLKCAAKLNLAFGFVLKNLQKMEGSDTFTHTKTIPCQIDRVLCAPMKTWQSYKIFSTKRTS